MEFNFIDNEDEAWRGDMTIHSNAQMQKPEMEPKPSGFLINVFFLCGPLRLGEHTLIIRMN